MKTYIFDIDGTICTDEKNVYDARPHWGRIELINKLYDEGNTIMFDSARGTLTGKDHQSSTEEQLNKWGVKYSFLRTGVKYFGDYYVDNKGLSDKDFFK